MTARDVAELALRPAREDDTEKFASFRCSTGAWYEQDVEEFLHRHALRRSLDPGDPYRLLVLIEAGELVACCAHEPEILLLSEGAEVAATRLQVIGLALAHQGRRFADGSRLSDAVLNVLMRDALKMHGNEVLTAIVAQDNLRSMRMCERAGLRSQTRFDSLHVRLSGRFVAGS